MANKKTVVEMYEELLTIDGLTQEQKDFLNKRIEITKKKNASGKDSTKLTKTQIENEGIKSVILSAMSKVATPTSITDLIKHSEELNGYSNQKVSALLTQLLKESKVVRTEEKGRSYYSLSAETADEGE